MQIFIASDHAGFKLKQELITYLKELGHEVYDKGPFEYKEDDDYPDFVIPVAKAVGSDPEKSRGIIIGSSGQGEATAANRFSGVRTAAYYGGNLDTIRLSREHNNANILSLGARFVASTEAREAVKLWLDTPFSGEERHRRRNDKLDA